MSACNALKSLKITTENGLLLAEISHDIRTALTRIRLAIEMFDHANGYLVSLIHQDIATCEALVDELIKKLLGHSQQQTTRVDLNHIIKDTVAIENRYAKRVEIDLYPQHLWITLQGLSMQRAVANLVTNALRYGNGWVRISSGCSKESVWFQVEDNGPGIAIAQIERLLQPFVRGEGAERLNPSGLGLGLAIVKRIVDDHKGQIQFCHSKHSGSQHGLIVKITLPL